MKNQLLALAVMAAFSGAASAGPFDQFKGKMKEGMYEYKMQMEMPGMPAGMAPQGHTFRKCLTKEDIDKGQMGRGGRDGQMPENCEVKNFKMSGNTASYTFVCKGEQEMTADNKIVFSDNGYKMDMDMSMNRGGQTMKMKQHMEGKYLGPCTDKK